MRDTHVEHPSAHGHEHGHDSVWTKVLHGVVGHKHNAADKVDRAMETSSEGIRALWVSFLILGVTAGLQVFVARVSGSASLLGDALHNGADALTALPLGLAFLLGRKKPTRRYTYGYGRAEDLAGVALVGGIALSALVAGYEAISHLHRHVAVSHLPYVGVAALVGFAGNETVAHYRIRVGKRIGSAALVADGMHARTDGLSSLAVLAGVGGVALGWSWADPLIGLVITLLILVVLKDAARQVYHRLMDAVDPSLVEQIGHVLRETPGVLGIGVVRVRWIGHQLRAECEVWVEDTHSVGVAHRIAHEAEVHLMEVVPRLTAAAIHVVPRSAGDTPCSSE